MRPAFSIIVFTVLSGAGFGLLFLAGVLLAAGWPLAAHAIVSLDGHALAFSPRASVQTRAMFAVVLVVGGMLAAAGLLASVAHLGKPLEPHVLADALTKVLRRTRG